MRGQWIFVLLCLSLVGELVLGSIFPGQDPPAPEKNSQTEVQLPNVATIPEVIINEAKTTTRDLNAEDQVQEKQWDGGNEDNAPRINAPTTAITHSEQKSTVDNVTTNVARVSTKMSPFVN